MSQIESLVSVAIKLFKINLSKAVFCNGCVFKKTPVFWQAVDIKGVWVLVGTDKKLLLMFPHYCFEACLPHTGGLRNCSGQKIGK